MDASTPDAPPAPQTPPDAAPAAPEYVFPKFGKSDFGGHHFDQKNGVMWFGVCIHSCDYMGALAFLRTMEHVLWQVYYEIARQAQIREQLARQSPPAARGIIDRLRGR